jgi:hypothetical protein
MNNNPRITVGIYFNARSDQGGLYQYALTLMDCLERHAPQFDYRLYHATLENPPFSARAPNWQSIRLPEWGIKLRMGVEYLLITALRQTLPACLPMEFSGDFSDSRSATSVPAGIPRGFGTR